MSNNKTIINYAENYFERNKTCKEHPGDHIIYLTNLLKNEEINLICEVGCFKGTQLNYLCSKLNSKGIGIDASEKSILNARKIYTNLFFKQGLSTSLEVENDTVDLMVFGFFLYILSEDDYNKSIDEARKKIKKGKFFYIFDFDSNSENKCKHDNKITITKRDHSNLKGFKLLEKKVYYEKSNSSYLDGYNRMSLWLFIKI